MAAVCDPLADSSFGPLVDENCRAFDFTLYFEETILRIGTSSLFLILAIVRLFVVFSRPRCIAKDRLLLAKMVTTFAYAFVQLVVVFYAVKINQESQALTEAVLAAAAINLAAALVIFVLSPMEHLKTLRPSTLISTFLFFTTIFDAAWIRTLWLINADVAPVASACIGVKVILLVVEAKGKASSVLAKSDTYGRDELSGIFSKSLFLWLMELLRVGYGKVLSVTDLYPLDDALNSTTLAKNFAEPWNAASKKHKKGGLFIALAVSLKWHIFYPVFPLLCFIAFTFAQPLLADRVLDYLADLQDSPADIGYGLIGAYAIVYTGIAISQGWYQYFLYRFVTMVRGVLVGFIYDKVLTIPIVATEDSDALTLMSTDVERIVQGLFGLYESWSTALQVAIAAYLLERQLGMPFFLPIVLCFACISVALALSVLGGIRQIPWLEAIKERLAITSSTIKGMKGVKMLGLSKRLHDLVQKLRVDEISAAFQYRLIMSAVIVVAFIPQAFAPVITFGAGLAGLGNQDWSLAASKIFTSVLLLRLLTQPLVQLFQAVPLLIAAVGCVSRIEAFAQSMERVDKRSYKIRPSSTSSNPYLNVRLWRTFSTVGKAALERREKVREEESTSDDARAVRVVGASFGWKTGPEMNRPVIKDLNLDLYFGKLTIIVGSAGSGKSTLLKGLLGETPLFEGQVELCERNIGFCDQTPWLTHGTIQETILGVSPWSQSWYKTVVNACALDEDFANLAGGDQADLGSNGINLSGGQKQRVAIARAVYSRCKIIVLDDVMSGLDRKTEKILFDRLLSTEGLLRREGVSVVLATHSVHFLPRADWIVSLNSEGEVSEQGTFFQLRTSKGYVGQLDLTQKEAEPSTSTESKESIKSPNYAFGLGKEQAQPAPDAGSRQTGDFAVYLYYFRASGLGNFAYYAALQLLWAFFATFPTVWLNWWSEALITDNPRNSYYFGAYSAFQVVYIVILGLLCVHVLLHMQVISGKKLHDVINTAVSRAPMSYFNLTDAGETLNIFSQDLQILDYELPFALQNTIANLLLSIAQAILLLPSSYWLGISFPFLILAFYLIQRFYLRTSRQLRLLDLEAKSPLYSSFLESLAGLATIRAFGWQKNSIATNMQLLDHSQRPFYLLNCLQKWLTLVLELLVAGIAILLIVLATQLKNGSGPGFTGVALINLAELAQTMTQTVTMWTMTEVAMGAVARIKKFREDTMDENLPTEIDQPPPEWPSHGSVRFWNVSAKYKEDGVKVMKNLTLSIQPGEKVAICGRTGSGKSTLVQVLFRMLDPCEGMITVDGIDLATLDRNSVRSQLNAIPQESFFVSGSIRMNLDIHGGATDADLLRALETVQLLKSVEAMGGLDCRLEPELLSHGQKQMFCLARAILRRSSLVVLDEATSSVDVETDKKMQQIIRSEFQGCTIIAIAHRLDTVLDFDKIAVLDHGELAEFDAPKILLERDSIFRSLYEAGAGGNSV